MRGRDTTGRVSKAKGENEENVTPLNLQMVIQDLPMINRVYPKPSMKSRRDFALQPDKRILFAALIAR